MPRKLPKWFFPASLCLAGCPIDPFLPPWCLASCPLSPFLPPWCLSGCPNGPFLPPWCLPEGNISKASLCYGQPAVSPPQDLPRTGPIAIEIVLKVRQNLAPFQNRDSIGNPAPQVSHLRGCLKWFFPWCLAGSKLFFSFPASLVPRKLSTKSFPASLVPLRLPNRADRH